MRIVRGVFFLVLATILVATVLMAGLLAYVTARALPQEGGTEHVAGLGTSVSVVHDAAGIAHVTADSPHDLFFAQSWVHASERTWQMEVWRAARVVFNDGPHAVPGMAGAINNTYYRFTAAYPDPEDPTYRPVGIDHVFDVTNMPSYRLTIDMGDLNGARIVVTTGQAGNPFDRHYNDQVDLWASGRTVALPFTTGAIAVAAVSTLSLSP